MMPMRSCLPGFFLFLFLSTTASAQQCPIDDRQAALNGKIYAELNVLAPSQQAWFLAQAGCPLKNFPRLEAAIGACACKPEFGCIVINVLLQGGKLRATDPYAMFCQKRP